MPTQISNEAIEAAAVRAETWPNNICYIIDDNLWPALTAASVDGHSISEVNPKWKAFGDKLNDYLECFYSRYDKINGQEYVGDLSHEDRSTLASRIRAMKRG